MDNPFGNSQRQPGRAECGALKKCAFRSYSCARSAVEVFNNDSSYSAEAVREGGKTVLTVTEKPQFGSVTETVYALAPADTERLEAFIRENDLVSLSLLPSLPCPVGGTVSKSLVLEFENPGQTVVIDVQSLQETGRSQTADAFISLLTGFAESARKVSEKVTPVISYQAQQLLGSRAELPGSLTACEITDGPFDVSERNTEYNRQITLTRDADGAYIEIKKEGRFIHTEIKKYRVSNAVFEAAEAFIKKENIAVLSALRGGSGFGMAAFPARKKGIDLFFGGETKIGLDISAMSANGAGYLADKLTSIITDAAENGEIVSSEEIINERVQAVETLRKQAPPHGALTGFVYSSGAVNEGRPVFTDSYYRYIVEKSEGGALITAEMKAQYRNKEITVYRDATGLLEKAGEFAAGENLPAFSHLPAAGQSFGMIPNNVTLIYDGETYALNGAALDGYGAGYLLSTLYQLTVQAVSQAAAVSRRWVCLACGKEDNTGDVCACGMRKDAVITQNPQPPVTGGGLTCPCCGKAGCSGRFCPECGAQIQ